MAHGLFMASSGISQLFMFDDRRYLADKMSSPYRPKYFLRIEGSWIDRAEQKYPNFAGSGRHTVIWRSRVRG